MKNSAGIRFESRERLQTVEMKRVAVYDGKKFLGFLFRDWSNLGGEGWNFSFPLAEGMFTGCRTSDTREEAFARLMKTREYMNVKNQ